MDEKGIVYEHTINYYETDRMGIVHHYNQVLFSLDNLFSLLQKSVYN